MFEARKRKRARQHSSSLMAIADSSSVFSVCIRVIFSYILPDRFFSYWKGVNFDLEIFLPYLMLWAVAIECICVCV